MEFRESPFEPFCEIDNIITITRNVISNSFSGLSEYEACKDNQFSGFP